MGRQNKCLSCYRLHRCVCICYLSMPFLVNYIPSKLKTKLQGIRMAQNGFDIKETKWKHDCTLLLAKL